MHTRGAYGALLATLPYSAVRQDLLTVSLLPPLQVLSADVLCGDLVGPIAQRIRGCVDLLVRSNKLQINFTAFEHVELLVPFSCSKI